MPQTRHGTTVPAYTDIADGPGAFINLVDGGVLPKFTSFSALVADWSGTVNDGMVAVVTADERYAIAPSPMNICMARGQKWYALVPRRFQLPGLTAAIVGNAGGTAVNVLTGSFKVDDYANVTFDGFVTIDMSHINDGTRSWRVRVERSDNGTVWTGVVDNTFSFFQQAPSSAPGMSNIPVSGTFQRAQVSAAGKDPMTTVQVRMSVTATRTTGAPECMSVQAGCFLNVWTSVAGGWG